jgi:hypothetical protein
MRASYHFLAANRSKRQQKRLRNTPFDLCFVMLNHMRHVGVCAAVCLPLLASATQAAPSASCLQGARQYYPCELSFDMQPDELSSPQAAMDADLLHIEFRSPNHITYLMWPFWSGGRTVRVRFTPTEPGEWAYKITSGSKRLDGQEANFTVAESSEAGLVKVANLRHWRTTNKQPHLWLAAGVRWFDLDQAAFESWLEARKKNGFTHIRGILLSGGGAKPWGADGLPNLRYFEALDEKILAAANHAFTIDLVIADESFVRSGVFQAREKLDPLIRYLVARYGGLNVTWQGLERFEDIQYGDAQGSRALLRDIGLALKKYDGFEHPRSTDARVSSSPLLGDGWMNFIMEASPHPELAAVEHQFTEQPSIHVITSADPAAFRRELWNSTANGEYPSVPFEALQNAANVKAVEAWFHVVSGTRHWEFEPYFEVDGARAAGLEDVEYLAYAGKPGIVEINLPRHKYNPIWIDPISGEETPLKDYRGEVFSRETPDNLHDWVLQVPREGHKESMARSYYFESQDPPVQEVESDAAKIPIEIVDPPGDRISVRAPAPFTVKITRANRATRYVQYVWWGEVVAGGAGARVLGIGPSGTLTMPKALAQPGAILNLRLEAINANGKAYELDRVYTLTP